MTIRQLVICELQARPWQTMTQVAHRIDRAPASVSSVMHRMRWGSRRTLMSTRIFRGPRGGVTYAVRGKGSLLNMEQRLQRS